MRFTGRTVIVTGGGSGLGREIALRFGAEGARVVVSDIVPARVEEMIGLITGAGGQAIGVAGDVTDPAYAEKLVALAGTVDVLVNSAGINDGARPVDETGIDLWKRVIDVNLTGTFIMAKAALTPMLAAGRGVILNISSVAGVAPFAGAAYTSSKHAVIGLTKSIAGFYSEDGIRCIAICPGTVPSNLSENQPKSTSARVLRRKSYREKRPAPGTPRQIADVVLFMASDEASYVNGTAAVVDGGLLAW